MKIFQFLLIVFLVVLFAEPGNQQTLRDNPFPWELGHSQEWKPLKNEMNRSLTRSQIETKFIEGSQRGLAPQWSDLREAPTVEFVNKLSQLCRLIWNVQYVEGTLRNCKPTRILMDVGRPPVYQVYLSEVEGPNRIRADLLKCECAYYSMAPNQEGKPITPLQTIFIAYYRQAEYFELQQMNYHDDNDNTLIISDFVTNVLIDYFATVPMFH